MNILLFSMPDSFEHMPPIAIRMPNGALTSLAGNVDPHHRVAAADLLLVQDRVRETVVNAGEKMHQRAGVNLHHGMDPKCRHGRAFAARQTG